MNRGYNCKRQLTSARDRSYPNLIDQKPAYSHITSQACHQWRKTIVAWNLNSSNINQDKICTAWVDILDYILSTVLLICPRKMYLNLLGYSILQEPHRMSLPSTSLQHSSAPTNQFDQPPSIPQLQPSERGPQWYSRVRSEQPGLDEWVLVAQ